MKTCPYCAEAIQEDSQFCQFCGTNLGSPPVPAASSIAAAYSTESYTSGKAIASLICGIFFFISTGRDRRGYFTVTCPTRRFRKASAEFGEGV